MRTSNDLTAIAKKFLNFFLITVLLLQETIQMANIDQPNPEYIICL